MSSQNTPDQPGGQQWASPAAPQPQYSPPPGSPQQRPRPFNVLGLVAVIALAVYACYAFIQPFIMRQLIDSGSFAALSMINGVLLFVCAFTAVALAIIGLVQQREARARWLSWVALGGAGMAVLQTVLGLIGNWLAFELLPY